ncbi:MAG: hypothetical protein JWO36_6808 [Myxococcales bacterium]|nr:hypothetical protein [Myxococcales bacterium]
MTAAPVAEKPKKLTIGSLDDTDLHVEAQYNPKEVTISHTIPWKDHPKGNTDGLQQEYSGGAARETTIDLFFDGVETGGNVPGGGTVVDQIKKLNQMASVRDSSSTKDEMRRPHHCCLVWSGLLADTSSFQCVIMSVSTKYQMFKADGTPLRATCTVVLKEATRVMMAEAPAPAPTGAGKA